MTTTKTLEEVKTHCDGKSCWLVIHDKVYDVTTFMEEHPGGEEVLLEIAGRDATEQFEDVGHSVDARELLQNYYIADLDEKDCAKKPTPSKPTSTTSTTEQQSGLSTIVIAASLLVIGVAVGYMLYINRT